MRYFVCAKERNSKRNSADTHTFLQAKDLAKARKQAEKAFPPEKYEILDIPEISEPTYWYLKWWFDRTLEHDFNARLAEELGEDRSKPYVMIHVKLKKSKKNIADGFFFGKAKDKADARKQAEKVFAADQYEFLDFNRITEASYFYQEKLYNYVSQFQESELNEGENENE